MVKTFILLRICDFRFPLTSKRDVIHDGLFLLSIRLLLLRFRITGTSTWLYQVWSLSWKHEWSPSLSWLLPLLPLPGLVLHEEHIELFSEDFKALQKEVEGKVFQEGTLHFTGDFQQEATRLSPGRHCLRTEDVVKCQCDILEGNNVSSSRGRSQAWCWFPSLQWPRSPHLAGGAVWTAVGHCSCLWGGRGAELQQDDGHVSN